MKKTFISIGVLALFLVPLVGFAANNFLGPIVPEELFERGPYLRGCDIVVLFDSVLKFAVGFTVLVATVMFAYAGFLYVTASSRVENIKQATKIFSTVAFGLFWVLAAWLIINLIMGVLVDQTKFPWNEIKCIEYPEGGARPGTGGVTGGTPSSGTTPTGDSLNHDDALSQLNAAGIQVTTTRGPEGVQAECSGVGCTSLEGIQTQVIENTVNLKNGCGENCQVIVTGATEKDVHDPDSGHEQGRKIDLDNTPSLNTYITSSGKFTLFNGTYYDVCGNAYRQEPTHWDVEVSQACGF